MDTGRAAAAPDEAEPSGPLVGVRVVELAGIGPGPFAATMLADLGADVVRVDRPATPREGARRDSVILNRSRRSVAVDLKEPRGVDTVLQLAERAHVLVEGYRPGVAERLGVGPEDCWARNPALVYGRITGWGQEGPYADAAGHDINYLAVSGALAAIRRRGEAPLAPVNFLADFGGGGMLLVVGVLSALLEARRSGRGQVVDAAMVDGAALFTGPFLGKMAVGEWHGEPGTNTIDTGSHFYGVYECADGRFVAIGAVEPQFYAALLDRLGLADDPAWDAQLDEDRWPVLKERLAVLFRTRTRDEWCEVLEGPDTCFAPVLEMGEAHLHPHNRARRTFVEHSGIVQPAPAPRFSRTPGAISRRPCAAGEHTAEVLRDWGVAP